MVFLKAREGTPTENTSPTRRPSVASTAQPLNNDDTLHIQRPSVPSSSGVPIQGSGNDDNRAEGAKNNWVRTGCHWKLKICTYNARSLSSDHRVIEFEDEIARIKFDIIGISETRRKGEGCLTLNTSGHTFYYKGGDTCHRGVGFIVNFAESHQLKIMNTFFKKRLHRRWTWISPNGVTKNEIDYIITDEPQTFTDVSVINSFNTGSDHRMIRGSMTINTRLERARLIKRPNKANAVALSAKAAEFQLLLTNKFDALNSAPADDTITYCDSITSSITEAALNTAGKDKARRPDKLSHWSQSSYG